MSKGMSEGGRPNVGPPSEERIETGNPDTDGQIRVMLGKAIRVRREKAGLTQVGAAELLGVSRDTLIRWERGLGSLWTGGPGRTIDAKMMEMLSVVYKTLGLANNTPSVAALLGSGPLRNQYPSAPLDPALRREFFWRRNALHQKHDPDEAVAMHGASHAERTEARAKR